ncbi:hypothetical protein [Halothiobacillus sp.]|uniref:hypothetical protein n=1 Tax=Halothiobacillus sp. TaxID=1891311 RepID=UPI002AD20DCC|nr:hypothetical protein [Halothiobacillus sp.]
MLEPDTEQPKAPDAKIEGKPNARIPTDLTPQLVKRAHQRDEDPGCKDIPSVDALAGA